MQAVGNLEEQKLPANSRKKKYLFANVKYGARLDCQKNSKALNNSARKLLLPGQAHTQPEQIIVLLFYYPLFSFGESTHLFQIPEQRCDRSLQLELCLTTKCAS